ncbi:hypothetical protein Tco_0817835 [Tanacetum coccineum]
MLGSLQALYGFGRLRHSSAFGPMASNWGSLGRIRVVDRGFDGLVGGMWIGAGGLIHGFVGRNGWLRDGVPVLVVGGGEWWSLKIGGMGMELWVVYGTGGWGEVEALGTTRGIDERIWGWCRLWGVHRRFQVVGRGDLGCGCVVEYWDVVVSASVPTFMLLAKNETIRV